MTRHESIWTQSVMKTYLIGTWELSFTTVQQL